jgi:hypothetical protein
MWAKKHGYTTNQAIAFIFHQMCIYNDITHGEGDNNESSYFGEAFSSFLED